MSKKTEMTFSATFFGFCFLAWLQIQKLPKQGAAAEDLGTDFFPLVCIAGIAFMACVLLLRAFLLKSPVPTEEALEKDAYWRIGATFILMVAYALCYELLGFYLCTFLFAVSTLLVMNERGIGKLLLFPLGMELCVYIGFEKILKVVLPEGELLYSLFPGLF